MVLRSVDLRPEVAQPSQPDCGHSGVSEVSGVQRRCVGAEREIRRAAVDGNLLDEAWRDRRSVDDVDAVIPGAAHVRARIIADHGRGVGANVDRARLPGSGIDDLQQAGVLGDEIRDLQPIPARGHRDIERSRWHMPFRYRSREDSGIDDGDQRVVRVRDVYPGSIGGYREMPLRMPQLDLFDHLAGLRVEHLQPCSTGRAGRRQRCGWRQPSRRRRPAHHPSGRRRYASPAHPTTPGSAP